MINPLYLPELREMLAENDADDLREFCTALHPARTAEFMEGLDPESAWRVLTFADMPQRVEIFSYFEESMQLSILETADRRAIGQLIAHLPPDDRVDLLNKVDPRIVDELFPLIPLKARRDILRLSSYPEGTAGALMTTGFARLDENLSVAAALGEIGRQAERLETIYYVYIVDEGGHLRGLVSARQLVSNLGHPEMKIGELMETELVAVNVTDDQEKVAEKVAHFDLLAIPVVDHEHHLLGIITHDDIIDVMREEATEDALRLSAVDPLEASYLNTHWFTITWKRGIWLIILFFAAMITAYSLRSFEDALQQVSWLVLFIPLVISSGGNSGSQSATLVITAMTSGDVKLRDWARVVKRELITGLCLGAFLGLLGYGIAYLLTPDPFSALVIPVTITLVVICGTLCGSILPMLFRRLGLDPALMSNPFVAGLIDIAGIIIYMQVSMLMLQELRESTGN
ncbi:MAG: magnesium transporter [Pirellulales bacterium]